MNLFHPRWDAEVAAGDAVLRAVRLAQHAGARRLAEQVENGKLAVITPSGLQLVTAVEPVIGP